MLLLISGGPVLAEEVRWLAPVDAPIADPFRPPAGPYGAGNRGLEFDVSTPTDVRAVDDGRVAFAGKVGRDLFLTIDHGGGLMSTLAFLHSINVVRGQFVSVGDIVATAGAGLHLTARLDGVYIDPALLLAGAELGVALIAGPAAPGGAVPPQRALPPQGSVERGRFDSILAVADASIGRLPSEVLIETAEAAGAWHHRDCSTVNGGIATSPEGHTIDLRPADAGDRLLIQVGGLGSSSAEASIGKLDPLSLGYDLTDVKGFSYAGGCIPAPFGFDSPGFTVEGHEPTPYSPEDTLQSIELSAGRLADLIETAAAARPGAKIDVAAHSLGGVVTRRALELLAARGSEQSLGVVMTIGSPHQGADLATVASAADGGLNAVDVLAPDVGELRSAPSVIQLSEIGSSAAGPSSPPPDGPTAIAIAGSTDLIVPAQAAVWDGATNVLVNLGNPLGAHSDLPGAVAVHDAFALALAGAAPPCVSLAHAVSGVTASAVVGAAEDAATVAAGIASWLL